MQQPIELARTVEQSTPDRIVVLPPAPLCARCGHSLCPCCGDWCDTGTADGDLCCDGRCQAEPLDVLSWQNQCMPLVIAALAAFPDEREVTVLPALGPWLPVALRRRRP